jgi:hypothetical protein
VGGRGGGGRTSEGDGLGESEDGERFPFVLLLGEAEVVPCLGV